MKKILLFFIERLRKELFNPTGIKEKRRHRNGKKMSIDQLSNKYERDRIK